MKRKLKNILGFRSGIPWRSIVAVIYYFACFAYLIIAMVTPPLVAAGLWDTLIVKVSSIVIFLWMMSPAIFLSNTPLRDKLPFFKDHLRMQSLVGMMIVFVLFQFLFLAVEGLHSQEYQLLFQEYMNSLYV